MPIQMVQQQQQQLHQQPQQLHQQHQQLHQLQQQPQLHQQLQLQQQLGRQSVVVQRAVSMPAMTRVVQQQQPGIIRRIVVPTTGTATSTMPMPVTQFRPVGTMPRFIRPNGSLQATPVTVGSSPTGPMKICIIQSPRKPDGTPVSPGSSTPGIVVMNPPENFRQLNINDVLRAISVQNASTSSAVMQQNATSAVANVVHRNPSVAGAMDVDATQKLSTAEATNGLVHSQVS